MTMTKSNCENLDMRVPSLHTQCLLSFSRNHLNANNVTCYEI